MVVKGAFLVKMTFQIIFEQNFENATAKKARNKDKGRFLVFLLKMLACKIG